MLQLSVDQIDELDRTARRAGVSRSQLVRNAVDALIDPPSNVDIAEQYARAYPVPTDGVDDWGDLDVWHAAARSERIDAASGHTPTEVRGAW